MTTRESVKALEAEGFEDRGEGVWGVDLDIYDMRFTLFLSPLDVGNEYVVWWMEWNHAQQEGDDVKRGTFKEMALVAIVHKQLADCGEWESLGFYCPDDTFSEDDLREDIKADVMREEEPEQMSLI